MNKRTFSIWLYIIVGIILFAIITIGGFIVFQNLWATLFLGCVYYVSFIWWGQDRVKPVQILPAPKQKKPAPPPPDDLPKLTPET